MFCIHCGKKIDADSSFCSFCGCSISNFDNPKYCGSCGAELEEESAFCGFCGSKISEIKEVNKPENIERKSKSFEISQHYANNENIKNSKEETISLKKFGIQVLKVIHILEYLFAILFCIPTISLVIKGVEDISCFVVCLAFFIIPIYTSVIRHKDISIKKKIIKSIVIIPIASVIGIIMFGILSEI